LLNELAKVDLVPNKGKFQAYLANATPAHTISRCG
jgi:hypothetical protein